MGTAKVGWWLLPLLLAWAGSAHAQTDATRAAARELGAEGVEEFQAGNYVSASDKLGRAFKTVRAPSLGLWSARALVKLGKLVEGSERYLDVTRLDASSGDTAVQKQAQQDATRERDELLSRIPSLTIKVVGAGSDLSLTLDGQPVPTELLDARQPANPGSHRLEARSGGRMLTRDITLSEGQKLGIELDFAQAAPATAPAAAAPASSAGPPAPSAVKASRPVPAGVWVGVALAGAGVATGGIAAFLASSKRNDMNCPNDVCPDAERSKGEAYNDLLTVSTVGFIAGGVGVALAGTFWFTRPKATEQQAHVTPWLGVGSAGVRGSF